jgi:rhodanese-related sulfurtransferase
MRRDRFYRTFIFVIMVYGSATSIYAQTNNSVDAAAVPRLTLADFRSLHAAGDTLVIDVRQPTSFESGHIPGAVNVPLGDVAARAAEIKAAANGRRVVTYCSCASEQSSAAAGALLMARAVPHVSALVGGYVEWVRAGGQVARGR